LALGAIFGRKVVCREVGEGIGLAAAVSGICRAIASVLSGRWPS